jgi:dihydrofolate reductase
MRKLVVSTYTTLDGVIQPLDWSGQDHSLEAQEERGAYARELLFSADALLLGRETYEIFAEAWSSRTSADDGPGEAGCVDRINSLPKHVASTTLREPLAWNATLLQGDIPAAVSKLKDQPGQTIMMYGCGQLARTLLEHGLIDEFLFWVYPVVRGAGRDSSPMAPMLTWSSWNHARSRLVTLCSPAGRSGKPEGLWGIRT